MSLGTEVGLGLRDIVIDVDPATPRKKGTLTPIQFLAYVYCGQMAGLMKTPLATEVDLGPGHTVLDRVPAPAKGAQQPPLFGPCLLFKQVLSSSGDGRPFGLNRHGPKIWGRGAVPLLEGGAGSPCNTMRPGLRPTFMRSGIFIHPAVWPQQTDGRKALGSLR